MPAKKKKESGDKVTDGWIKAIDTAGNEARSRELLRREKVKVFLENLRATAPSGVDLAWQVRVRELLKAHDDEGFLHVDEFMDELRRALAEET